MEICDFILQDFNFFIICTIIKSRGIRKDLQSNGHKFKFISMPSRQYSFILIILALLPNILCVYISKTEPQSVESIVAYRKIVKQNNQRYIKASNSKNKAYVLQPYPWLVSLTVQQYSMMYTNRVMIEQQHLLIASVEKPSLSADQLYARKVGMRMVNNSLWTGRIRNQGRCGSCYAFAATSLINYVASAQNNAITPIEASEQQIAECSSGFRNKGCDGGWPHLALLYARQMDISSNISYPYRFQTYNNSQLKNCTVIGKTDKQFKIKKYVVQLVVSATSQKMMSLVDNHGALAIGLISSTPKFMFYKNGTLDNCGEQAKDKYIDHAVTIQGYYSDPQGSTQYWMIKNSWGNSWGENGRMRLAMNSNCKEGHVVCFLKNN